MGNAEHVRIAQAAHGLMFWTVDQFSSQLCKEASVVGSIDVIFSHTTVIFVPSFIRLRLFRPSKMKLDSITWFMDDLC